MASDENDTMAASAPESDHSHRSPSPPTKRKSETAEDKANRPIKRRASRACHSCRKRKVRCNVVESGPPCTNCRLDQVHCFLNESKRRRKNIDPELSLGPIAENTGTEAHVSANGGIVNPQTDLTNSDTYRQHAGSHSPTDGDSELEAGADQHVPHLIYRTQGQRLSFSERERRASIASTMKPPSLPALMKAVSPHGDLESTHLFGPPMTTHSTHAPLPAYIKPIPSRFDPMDVQYLWNKDALSVPDRTLRNELLKSFIEYVYPYMPLIELHDFLNIVDQENGAAGKISLLLFQAVMFSGTAFIDMRHLINAGYTTRQAARRAFFQKARLLYDFDYEQDRLALVQSILLMTFWYETPDDQKDTWHWMGVAVSLAHTIGLNRNPESSTMDMKKKRLWKRVWWSCFMRDRLIALGMRRPTRIREGDFDVPMLRPEDFEIRAVPVTNSAVPLDCTLIRDVEKQRSLAVMCIAMAQLTLCISRILTSQYSIYVKDQGAQGPQGTTRSSVILYPKRPDQTDEVKICDEQLRTWLANLPPAAHFTAPGRAYVPDACPPLTLQRAQLQLIYYTTVSALHRPQVLPSHQTELNRLPEVQDWSKDQVRLASKEITQIVWELHELNLDRYLPTTGTTVLLPAIIIHLLDIKSSQREVSETAKIGFFHCMLVLQRFRDIYPAADFASAFLDAALRKAHVSLDQVVPSDVELSVPIERLKFISDEKGVSHAFRIIYSARSNRSRHITPPPDFSNLATFTDDAIQYLSMPKGQHKAARHNPTAFATSPPDSDVVDSNVSNGEPHSGLSDADLEIDPALTLDVGNKHNDIQVNYEDMIDFGGGDLEHESDPWSLQGSHDPHGESGGFNFNDLGLTSNGDGDISWAALTNMPHDGSLGLPDNIDVLEV